MSRSFKKTPRTGITKAETEKDNRRLANRKLRNATKSQVRKGDVEISTIREVSNVWAFDKDGKQFLKKSDEEGLKEIA